MPVEFTTASLLTDAIGAIGDANMWPVIGAVAIVALAGFLFRKFGGKTR